MPVPPLNFFFPAATGITPDQADTNIRLLRDFANGLENRMNASLDSAGNIQKAAVTLDIIETALAQIVDNITIGFDPTVAVLAGDIVIAQNPAPGDTLVILVNGTAVNFTFVSSIGSTAGNILIGATPASTASNLITLLRAPLNSSSNCVALAASAATLIGYSTYTLDSNDITIVGGASLTSLGATTSAAAIGWFPTITGKLKTLSGSFPPKMSEKVVTQYLTANTLSVSATYVILKNASGSAFAATNIAQNISTLTAGLNGLDTGAIAPSTWYYIWVVSNTVTNSVMLSLSNVAPTLTGSTSAFTYNALVGAVRTDGSSNLQPFTSRNRQVWVAETLTTVSGTSGTSNVAAIVPPIAIAVSGTLGLASSSFSTVARGITIWGTIVGGSPMGRCTWNGAGAGGNLNGFYGGAPYRVPMDSNLLMNWTVLENAATYGFSINGYEF